MSNHFLGRKWHIKPRIFVMLVLLLAMVFTSIFVAFNLFIHSYIRTNVQEQLDTLVGNFGMYNDKPREKPAGDPKGNPMGDPAGKPMGDPASNPMGDPANNPMGDPASNPTDGPTNSPMGDPNIPDLSGQKKNRFGFRGEVIILDSNYEITSYDERGSNEDIDELRRIAYSLKSQNVPLSSARYVYVGTDEDAYYISSIEDIKRPGSFLVFYVSVASIDHLVDTVNLSMIIIMAAAMLICFVIANVIAGSITKPVKVLSDFAEEIGKSNFQRRAFAFQDIEFDELGEAMNQSAEKLDAYDKDQRAFFQNVSHELRTPLQSIRCYAEGIEYGLMDPKKSGATIISETDRLSELVEDLLYISRVDSISSHVEMQESDLRDTLSLCAENLRPMADKKGLRYEYQFDDEPVLFAYNEKHMYRAFSNLLSNALRYAVKTITLRCRNRDGQIEVSVIDDGPGISFEDLRHIFERFYKGRDGKHGIGLSIVKSVVELHGGEITVDCSEGTRFTILFPKK